MGTSEVVVEMSLKGRSRRPRRSQGAPLMAPGPLLTAGCSPPVPPGAWQSAASTSTGHFQAEGEGPVHHIHLQPPAR